MREVEAGIGATGRAKPPRRFTFLLLPEFSMMPFTAAVEPLRAANRMSGAAHYSWRVASRDGAAVKASNGIAVLPDAALADAGATDVLVVCGGLNVARYVDDGVIRALRRLAVSGAMIGSVCTGSVALAEAGLLDDHRCTIHWEDVAVFAEKYPRIDVTTRLFEIDRNRFTCSGGTAPLDLMLHFIAADFQRELSVSVAELMLHHLARGAGEPQRLSLRERTGIHHPKLLVVIGQMEAAIEIPTSLDVIAERAQVSQRQMERLFRSYLQTTPSRHYLELRLHRARALVRQTSASIMQIAVATGFSSPAHFSKCYRAAFGVTPTGDR